EYEEQVHATHLLDPVVLAGIEPHHLVTSLFGGLYLRGERGGVVTTRLGVSGTAGGGASVLGRQPHTDGFDAPREVRSCRGRDQLVHIFGSRSVHAESH